MSKRVLCLLADGFEEIETVTPVDLLRRAGVEVVIAALTETRQVTGRSGITLFTDAFLREVDVDSFDLLFIPGGPAVKLLREDGQAAALARSFAQQQKFIAAICAGPLVLHDAGLLAGKRHTAHDSTYTELTNADAEEKVIVDGRIITSRGAGTALAFGLALVTILCGELAAQKVSEAIMV